MEKNQNFTEWKKLEFLGNIKLKDSDPLKAKSSDRFFYTEFAKGRDADSLYSSNRFLKNYKNIKILKKLERHQILFNFANKSNFYKLLDIHEERKSEYR